MTGNWLARGIICVTVKEAFAKPRAVSPLRLVPSPPSAPLLLLSLKLHSTVTPFQQTQAKQHWGFPDEPAIILVFLIELCNKQSSVPLHPNPTRITSQFPLAKPSVHFTVPHRGDESDDNSKVSYLRMRNTSTPFSECKSEQVPLSSTTMLFIHLLSTPGDGRADSRWGGNRYVLSTCFSLDQCLYQGIKHPILQWHLPRGFEEFLLPILLSTYNQITS